jgi:hypothetical protein
MLLYVCAGLFAQERQAYMMPSKVYVGDRANLVLPLPGFTGNGDTEISKARIPFSPDIDIHRVALERRPGGNRLIIEFSAFMPGVLELPPIEIAGETFSGLTIEISSILNHGESSPVLSGPADPLAVPGTSLLVYGTLSASLAALVLALWAMLWGRRQVTDWLGTLKRWWLLIMMWGIETRLRKSLAKGTAYREILDTLSREFRSFLAYFSGQNCRAMTASEFGSIAFFKGGVSDSEFLGNYFSRCDVLRFSGKEITAAETETLLADLRSFLIALGKRKRGAP